MPAFVLDTNTVIDYFKGRGKVAERLLAVAPREIGLPGDMRETTGTDV